MACLATSAMVVFAQGKPITLNLQNAPLTAALQAIEKQTGYTFSYSDNVVAGGKAVSLKAENATIKTVLDKMAQATGLEYSMMPNDVIVVSKSKNNKETSKGTSLGKPLTGVVLDENGEPVIGASVVLKKTGRGVTTNIDGQFSLANVAMGDVVNISYIGYMPQSFTIKNAAHLSVQLTPSASNLDEVVVIGYGAQRKRDVTTSISSIKGDDLTDMPANSVEQALVGRMPGVQITQGTGMPGGGTSIKVRGTGTITAGSDPLYVIDGVPQSDLSGDATGTQVNPLGGIDMNDVESIEVLKDASAAAIYGSRGANGVIIITTKQGASGKPKVNYSGYVGWQQRTKKVDMLGAYDFARLVYDAHNNAYLDLCENKGISGSITDTNAQRLINMGAKASTTNVTYLIPDEIMPYINGEQGLTDTDWQDAVFRNGIVTKHSLSVSGGANGVDYFLSGNYAKEEGIVIGSGQETFGGRANINIKYNKVRFGVNTSIAHMIYDIVPTEDRFTKETVVASALAAAPIFPVYNEDGSYNFENYNWSHKQQAVLNPVAIANEREDRMKRNKVMGKAFFNWEIITDLNFKTEFSTIWNSFRR